MLKNLKVKAIFASFAFVLTLTGCANQAGDDSASGNPAEETEGIVVLEALASSCPVLVRDIGVYSDWLMDGRDCYKAKDNEEFLAKIDHIMTHDNSYIIKNGEQRMLERDIPLIGQELKKTYEYLLDKFKKNNK